MKREELPILIKAIQKGDQDAFTKLYLEFRTSFYYMALKLTNNDADANDVVQDTFLSIQKNIGTLKNPDVAIVWMKQILFNRCKNLFRKNRTLYMDEEKLAAMEVEEQHEEYLPSEVINKQSDRIIILTLLARIPYIYREPLLLKYYDDAKMSEIAQVLNIPEGTVKSRLRTGKKLLRDQIHIYERTTKEKVPFHLFPVGFLLYEGFRKEGVDTCAKRLGKKSYLTHSASFRLLARSTLITAASAGVIGYGVHTWMTHATSDKNDVEPKYVECSDQDAYFYIRSIAHCEEDLKQLKQADLISLQPYIEQLKKHESVFYQLLYEDDWMITYIELTE